MKRRVVVTGVGSVSPLGVNTSSMWSSILNGVIGIREIDYFDTTGYAVKIAGALPRDGYDPTLYMTRSEERRIDRFITYAIIAASQAFSDAEYENLTEGQRAKTAVIIGSGIGGVERLYDTSVTLYKDGARRVNPFFIPSVLINLASGHVAIRHNLTGPSYSVVAACASGICSIGEAFRLIRNGYVDFAIAGGAEAAICELGISGFSAAKALSTRYNDSPQEASRPWDKDRDGFVVGEGAGIIALETHESALSRGVRIYGEIIGCGVSCDAFHITSPLADGAMAAKAMQRALNDAEIDRSCVSYINAHGTSTLAGDLAEINAIKKVFGPYARELKVSSTKAAMGHLLGAAGAVETIICLMAMNDSVCPATFNLYNQDKGCDLDLVPRTHIAKKLDIVMNNSFGFGGTNASLVLKKIY